MSNECFQTHIDQLFFTKLYEQVKTIFGLQKKDWSCEQILRFLSLVKVQSKLETFFYEFKITGELLFDVKYLWQQMLNFLQNKTYFPIMKLMHIILRLNQYEKKSLHNFKFTFSNPELNLKKRKTSEKSERGASGGCQFKGQRGLQKNDKMSSQQNLSVGKKTCNNQITDLEDEEQDVIDMRFQLLRVQGQILLALDTEFKKLGQVLISDLSSHQVAKIFRATENQRAVDLSQLIKKYSIDGYSIVCLLADKELMLQQVASFFSKEEIQAFQEILNLLLPFYFRQMAETQQRQKTLRMNEHANMGFFSKPEGGGFENSANLKQSFGKSQYGTSQMCGQSEAMSQSLISQFGTSQYQPKLGKSRHEREQLGRSQCGRSVYQNSEFGNLQYASSQYATSEIGSVRGSMAQSVLGQSMLHQFQSKAQKRRDVHDSFLENITIIQKIKQVALYLPFNLFKMDPLQNIKVTTINYPFTLNFHKPKSHQQFVRSLKQSIHKLKSSCSISGISSKDFNITGVKFGRSQQNDFRYPDQLSISGKHAQISFFDNKYQLADLQSKTGTFLYIPLTRPLVLKDEHIIQLSNQIQLIVHIIKKDPTEGIIKLEFTKPQNQPFYKATLKQNQTLKIGRSEKSHIKLCQQSVSSKHTQIKYQNQQFKIYDCLSSTGTWLRLSKKGVKSQRFPLQQGDIIRISSKKTYLIQKMTNTLEQDDDFEQLSGLLENPSYKAIGQHIDYDFNRIIQNTMKRKTPYQKKSHVFEDNDTQITQ